LRVSRHMQCIFFRFDRAVLILTLIVLAGCQSPSKIPKYPSGALRVQYEDANSYTTCLVASVAMASNYLIGERKFTVTSIVDDLGRKAREETSISDLKDYLDENGLYMVTLSGKLDANPPTGLEYWVKKRGYPVICVINNRPKNPAFRHAILVIGISPNPKGGSADIIYYFDPSSVEALHHMDADEFERQWAPSEHAMMIVTKPYPEVKGNESLSQ